MNNSISGLLVVLLTLILITSRVSALNLAGNGAFESLEGWTASDPALAVLSTEVVEGKTCLKLTSAPGAAEGTDSTAISRMIDIKAFKPDGEYRMQFKARSDHFPQEYIIYLGIMQGQQLPVVIGYEWRQVGPNWQDVSLDFRDMNPVATGVKLVIQVRAKGSVWIDDLKIEQLPKGTIGAEDLQLKDLPKYKGSKDFVQITPTRRFLVKNKPFFPIGMWGLDFPNEKAMEDMHKYGFNITGTGHLIGRKAEGTKAFLDMAQAHGLMIIGVMRFAISGETEKAIAEAETYKPAYKPIVDVTKNHPAFFAYDLADESAWAGNSKSAFASGAHFFRENDPNHPVFSNQAPRQSISLFKRWYRFVDIGGSDIYPYWNGEPDRHSDLPNKTIAVVGDECTKNLTALGPGKPVLMTIQAFGWSDGNADPETKAKGYAYPPVTEQRFMVYDAITSGASGIMLYQDMKYNDASGSVIDPRVKPVSLELSAMHDILAAATAAKGATSLDKRVKLITKTFNNELYIIAVNTTDKNIQAKIKLPVSSKAWNVLFENRNIVTRTAAISDSFGPWDVNIYTNSTNKSFLHELENKAKTMR